MGWGAAATFGLLLIALGHRARDQRWVACNLWWWFCGSLPAAVSLKYGELFTSPRLHALASAGSVMLWAHVIIELGLIVRDT